MKLSCGPDQDTRRQRRRQKARDYWLNWHRWFAWYPVRIKEGDCRWMEFVERKADRVGAFGMIFEWTPYDFSYRALNT